MGTAWSDRGLRGGAWLAFVTPTHGEGLCGIWLYGDDHVEAVFARPDGDVFDGEAQLVALLADSPRFVGQDAQQIPGEGRAERAGPSGAGDSAWATRSVASNSSCMAARLLARFLSLWLSVCLRRACCPLLWLDHALHRRGLVGLLLSVRGSSYDGLFHHTCGPVNIASFHSCHAPVLILVTLSA